MIIDSIQSVEALRSYKQKTFNKWNNKSGRILWKNRRDLNFWCIFACLVEYYRNETLFAFKASLIMSYLWSISWPFFAYNSSGGPPIELSPLTLWKYSSRSIQRCTYRLGLTRGAPPPLSNNLNNYLNFDRRT
jgi:hypothetical protein